MSFGLGRENRTTGRGRFAGWRWLRRRWDGDCGADDGCHDGGGMARLRGGRWLRRRRRDGGSRGGSRAGIVRTRFQTIGLCSTMPTV